MTVIVNTSMCSTINPENYYTVPWGGSAATEIGNKIIGALQLFGSALSVVVLIILGIKYLLGSVEDKAEYKKSFIPYIIGAVLIFSVTFFLNIIWNIMA